jgi:bacillithiol biosynthesis cysteine-adding enzyme BshC
MEPSCVRHTNIPGTSNLFADFLYSFQKVKHYYGGYFGDSESYRDAAQQIGFPEERRKALVAALRQENGPSPQLDKLGQPGTVAVVTGQQVGLLSGPAYTVYKAVTAAKLAAELSANGIPAVPIFWLATEDHDLAEVDHAWLFDKNSVPHKVQLSATAHNGGPVGAVEFYDDLKQPVAAALADLPFAAEVQSVLAASYHPGAKLGRAFQSFLKEILKDLNLLFIDPLDPAIRELGAPFLKHAAQEIPALLPRLRARSNELEKAGYHAQVNVEADTSLLFLINGKRSPVRWKDGRFVAREGSFTPAELAAQGSALSPNALLRPVMQDFLLPTVAYVGGPAEVAYMAQAQVLYETLLGRMPVIVPRNSYTLLDARASKLLAKHDLKPTDLIGHEQQVKSHIAAKLVPAGLTGRFDQVRAQLHTSLDDLRHLLADFDPTLDSAAQKSSAKMLYQIDKLARKTANETLRRDERAADDARYLMNLVYPDGHLQERFFSIVPFLAKAGMDLPKRLLDDAKLTCPDHIVRAL